MNIYPEASAPPFDYHSYHTSTTEQPLYLHPEYRNLYILRSQQTYEQIETEYDEYEQREAIYTFLGAVILSIIFFLCVPFTACIPYLLMLKFNNTRQPTVRALNAIAWTLFTTFVLIYLFLAGLFGILLYTSASIIAPPL